MLNNFWIVVALIICIWGTIPIVMKMLLSRYPAYVIMIVSAVLFGLISLMAAMFFMDDISFHIRKFKKNDWLLMFYIVLLGSVISNLLYMDALHKFNSSVVVAVTSIFPLVTLIIAFFFMKEKITPITVIGVVFITIGVAMLSYQTQTSTWVKKS